MGEKEKQELEQKAIDKRAALLTMLTILDSLILNSTIGTWGVDIRINVSDPKEFRQRCKDALWYAIDQLDNQGRN